jgi:eukaryotic-like serine/threonine-protein kinase
MNSICPTCGINIQDLPPVEGKEMDGAIFEERYQLDQYLDEGAMAWVYKGVHMELGSSVAIKILKPTYQDDSQFLARFKKEAVAASALNHPNILSIITSGTTSSNITYIISEFIRGSSLAALLKKENVLPLGRTVRIAGQILSALDEAHNKGIIHRDIKPENIMISTLRSGEDFVKLVDFGIAKETNETGPRLTKHGELFGTPEYMSPEVIKGKEATHLSDIYSMGILVYELLTGVLPFQGEVVFDILKAHLEETPVNITRKRNGIPLEIDQLVLKALSKDPSERPQTAMEFKISLQDYFNESSGFIKCSACNHIMKTKHKFCPNCGATTNNIKTVGMIPRESIPIPTALKPVKPVDSEKDPTSSQVTETISRILFNENMLIPIFVGRERELDLITSFLYGDKIVLELNGPMGIGKSTLSSHIMSTLINDNVVGYITTSDPLMCHRPWYPIRKIFEKILKLSEDFTIEDLVKSLDKINLEKDDYPHIRRLMKNSGDTLLERNVEIREILTSAIRVILAAIGNKPALLVFDDIDEYDFPSRFFIDKLISTIQEFPIKIMVTSEKRFLDNHHLGETILLSTLDKKEVNPLILQLTSKKTGSWHGLVDNLFDSSTGLPLHIIQGAHLLLEGGTEIKANLVDLVSLRIGRLPAKSIKILQIVALYGKTAPLDLVYEFMDHDPVVSKTIEVLIKRGFLYQFNPFTVHLAHPILVEIVPSLMTGNLQREYHQFIFDFLKKNDGSIYTLAKHIFKTNDLHKAVDYLEYAGDEYEKELDDFSAASYYKHAYDIAKILSLKGERLGQFTRISFKLGDILRYTNQDAAAESVLKEGLLFCEGDPDTEALILSSLARLTLKTSEGTSDKACTLIQRALRLASSSKNSDIFYRVFFDMSSISHDTGSFSHGANLLKTGIAKAMSLFSGKPKFWRLFLKFAEFEFQNGNHENSISILMESLSIIDKNFDQSSLAKGRVHFLLGQIFSRLNSVNDSIPHLELAAEYLQLAGDRKTAAESFLMIAEHNHGIKENLKKAVFLSMQIGWKQGIERANTIESAFSYN